MSDAKQAALNLIPHDWFESQEVKGFKHDQNASRRKVAEEVFDHVFKLLNSEHVADGVARAFIRRAQRCGIADNRMNAANMSTALMYAVIAIRDNPTSKGGE